MLAEDTLIAAIDAYERQLDASGVLIREQERWPSGAQSDSTTALKGYIRSRLNAMDSYIRTLPTDKEDFDARNLSR